jgi:enamine deaminase RidA (YjgF/YER057c/UK114 family)
MNNAVFRCAKLAFYNVPKTSRSDITKQVFAQRRFIHIEQRLVELGIELPTAPSPKANYNIVCHASGNMLYVSGHLPIKLDGALITGRIGPNTGGESIPHGYEAARFAGLNIISTLKEQLGDLDRVAQIVKVSVYILLIFFEREKVTRIHVFSVKNIFFLIRSLVSCSPRATLRSNTK